MKATYFARIHWRAVCPIGFFLLAVLVFPGWPIKELAIRAAGPTDADGNPARPNVLWITYEDASPNLGCYGDSFARTPHLDALAAESVLYTQAFATCGVCAPARSCIITGMYPPSIGSHPMRSSARLPKNVHCFPTYLRKVGYYCCNNSKTDYNLTDFRGTWDENGGGAHWRKRAAGQPFFAVFNLTQTHESQIRSLETSRDPSQVPLPPYHPDTPEVRANWARYAEQVSIVDNHVAEILAQLELDGLDESTIVFVFSDHGAGMPRSKRWLYDSSLKVPLLVRIPEKFRELSEGEPGIRCHHLVSFVDMAPTVLTIAGVEVPQHMQGQTFLGRKLPPPRTYVYGHRDRMDERYDMLRCLRDDRFKYIRNFHPELPWFHEQHIAYLYEMPAMQVWQKLSDEGKLQGATAVFMARMKPLEELYDLQADPWETNNLASDPKHADRLKKYRGELIEWMKRIGDLGLLAESELHKLPAKQSPYDAFRRGELQVPFEELFSVAWTANQHGPADLQALADRCNDRHPAVRQWALLGLGLCVVPQDNVTAERALERMTVALQDNCGAVRATAAQSLMRWHQHEDAALHTLAELLTSANEWERLQAANILDHLDRQALPVAEHMRVACNDPNRYVRSVCLHAMEDLQGSQDEQPDAP